MTRYAIIDDTHPDLVYTGQWRTEPALNPKTPEYNNTVHATNDPEATITFNFYGTVLNVFGSINAPAVNGYPNASFTIQPNAVPIKHFNQSGTVPIIPAENLNVATSRVEMFKSGKFAEGNYTMTIKADGASANGPTYYFDFLTVLTPDSIYVEDVILDDNNDQWDYKGQWINTNETGNYLESLQDSPASGGSAALGFHGTEISVYGSLKGRYNASIPLGIFSIGGRDEKHTVYAGNVSTDAIQAAAVNSSLQNFLLFQTTGLPDIGQKQYTLTIDVPAQPSTTSASGTASTTSSATLTTSSASGTITPGPQLTNQPWQLDYVIYGPSYALSALPTSTASSASSPPPAGAIAGGVIGGLAGLSLLVLLFFLWRRRSQKAAATSEVKEEFSTAYATSAATSRPTLAGRQSSIRKGARADGGSGPVLDISASSPLASQDGSGGRGAGTSSLSMMSGPGTADTAYETEYTGYGGRRPLPPRPVRELDGGVRLATSEYDSEVVEVLPPSYARYNA